MSISAERIASGMRGHPLQLVAPLSLLAKEHSRRKKQCRDRRRQQPAPEFAVVQAQRGVQEPGRGADEPYPI